ncbi:MAG: prepilin-type N-terminal cleavage/methylation domain-containing protein [Candidatus Marinimicrobia bacterium]|jgi:type II secretory pathway pseudopilin PulG|nr:prepilin-type N-terminal cleavage/methylation domain-containing protein [Candidatus Neomarinimicrobiota bacterium]
MINFKREEGFTLIELIIGMLISSIILITVVVIVVSSKKCFIKGTNQLNLQRDYTFIVQLLSRNIRLGNKDSTYIYANYSAYENGTTSESGNCIQVNYSSGKEFVAYKDNMNLVVIDTSGTKNELVTQNIDNLSFYFNNVSGINKYLCFDLSISSNEKVITMQQIIYFRN